MQLAISVNNQFQYKSLLDYNDFLLGIFCKLDETLCQYSYSLQDQALPEQKGIAALQVVCLLTPSPLHT